MIRPPYLNIRYGDISDPELLTAVHVERARDLEASSRLLDVGATHAYPEAIETSLRLGATAPQMLRVPVNDIDLIGQGVRDWDYKPVLEKKQDK